MSIVKMKRLRLVGMRRDQGDLLRRLRRMGCVEIRRPQFPDDAPEFLAQPDGRALSELTRQAATLEDALDVLKREAPIKDKLLKTRPVVDEKTFFDDHRYQEALNTAEQINEAVRDINGYQSQLGKLHAQQASLAPWKELPTDLDAAPAKDVAFLFGSIPLRMERAAFTAGLDAVTDLYDVTWAGEDLENRYLLLLCHASALDEVQEALPGLDFNRINLKDFAGTAVDNDQRLTGEIKRIGDWIEAARAGIVEKGPCRDELRMALDRARQDISLERARQDLLDTRSAFYLEGWFPAEKETELAALLDEYVTAWESEVPTREEYPDVPVSLKNNGLSRPLSMVTDMYALPAYGTIDPNPLMAPFFIIFYGMMMADMAYGLIMTIFGLVVIRKTKPKGPTVRHMFPLMVWCGVSTFIWGAATGGFFGDFIPQLLKLINPNSTFALPVLFSPLDDAVPVLIGSLILGAVQVFVGMGVSMYKQIKRGEVLPALCNEGAWFLVFILAGVGFLTKALMPCIIAIVVVLVVTQAHGKKGFGIITGIFGAIYNGVTGYFSDILSYSRLMALMLAGAVVAQVFNQLGAMTGNVVIFVVVAMIGNALNFALNILGCYVHDMRLQCLEFFGRFYEDGGMAFRPLEVKTEYVDVVND